MKLKNRLVVNPVTDQRRGTTLTPKPIAYCREHYAASDGKRWGYADKREVLLNLNEATRKHAQRFFIKPVKSTNGGESYG